MTKIYKIAVIDDHPLMRRGIAETLSEVLDFEVIASGGSADDALRSVENDQPDLILLDAMMPGGGIDATRQITSRWREAKVIVLSIREDLETVKAALKAGARGYVSKGVIAGELIDAVRKVLNGGSYVSPELAARLLTVPESIGGQSLDAAVGPLSEREHDLLRLVGQGLSNLEIATRLGLAENTVKHQLTPLFRKLGVRNRTEAALLAGSRALTALA